MARALSAVSIFQLGNCSQMACIVTLWTIFFSPYSGRKCHFRSRLRNAMSYFRSGYGEIVYYTTREVKNGPGQSTCKLPPESKARVANMCSGVVLFMLRIRFFIIPGQKIPHSRFGGGSESGTFGQGMVKKSYMEICRAILEHV